MLKFSRNKLVTIARKDQDTLLVHGVLEDDIYGLEVDLSVQISDLKFLSISGKWNRWTTPECPRTSVPPLQEAVGWCIEEGINQKIQKVIARKSCRHFATILTECCESVKEAVEIIKWEDAKVENPNLSFEEFIGTIKNSQEPLAASCVRTEKPSVKSEEPGVKPEEPDLKLEIKSRPAQDKTSGGIVIDLHAHSFPASSCSSASEDALIEEAKHIGLDGICLTDHNYVWNESKIKDLSQKHGFLVLRGNEITTDQGHVLVFGLDKDIKVRGIVKMEELRQEVTKAEGFIILAHPFRGFLTFDTGQLGLTVQKAMERPLFKMVDAVETLNSKVTKKENNFASEVAQGLGFPTTGGSDAHEVSEVGYYATQFFDTVDSEKDLVHAFKNGNYSPVAFRNKLTVED